MRLPPAILLSSVAATSACGGSSAQGDAGINECPTFATFCDGFETGDTSRWSNTTVSSGGSLDVETTIVHSGRYALRATMPAGAVSGVSATVNETFPSQSTGEVAVRAWIYQPQALINNDGVLELCNTADEENMQIGGDSSGQWVVSEQGTSPNAYDSTTAVAQGTWLCVELDFVFDPTAPTAALYVGDAAVLGAAIDPVSALDRALFGVARADSAGSTTIVDDVVLASQHIGCP
jgi:hypothetical protein